MKLLSIALALVLSAGPCAAATTAVTPQSAATPKDGTVTQAAPRKPADCHRDVRIHRIGGVKIRHRHVGDNCAVREVRQAN